MSNQNCLSDKHTTVSPRQHREDRGASLVEYALLVSLIMVLAIVSIRGFGNARDDNFNYITNTLDGVWNPS